MNYLSWQSSLVSWWCVQWDCGLGERSLKDNGKVTSACPGIYKVLRDGKEERHHGTQAHEPSAACHDNSATWGHSSIQLLHQRAPGPKTYGSTGKRFVLFTPSPWSSQQHELCHVFSRSLSLIFTTPEKMQLIFLSDSHSIFTHSYNQSNIL